jgi:hypothetical protein
MTLSVSDRGSNKPELIVHAAEVLGRSTHKALVFKEIYTGKKKVKTAKEIASKTGLRHQRVLECGKELSRQDLVHQVKADGCTGYEKIDFFQTHRDCILRAAKNKNIRESIPTKRQGAKVSQITIQKISLPKRKVQAVKITIDDISSFKKVKKIKPNGYTKMPETKFKKGIAKILGEKGDFKDWGGENNDLSSTRLIIQGIRRTAAFAFKGPGKKGKLTPGKMGKNGDQIQRLAKCAAEVLVVQYWGQIEDSVHELLQSLATVKSYWEGKKIWYVVIDGVDSTRLIQAYPKEFQ